MVRRLGWMACLAVLLVSLGWLVWPLEAAADPPEPRPGDPPNSLCLICHSEPVAIAGSEAGPERKIDAVEADPFAASAHGEVACASCHRGQVRLPHPDWQAFGFAKLADATACQECHEDAYEAYMRSVHGTMVELGDARAPECADCHGDPHKVRTAEEWTDSDRAQACGECHSGATAGFTKALRHDPPSPDSRAASYFAERFLIILTAAVLAFGIIHAELQLLRWLSQRRASIPGRPRSDGE